jgi:hypothetical protein
MLDQDIILNKLYLIGKLLEIKNTKKNIHCPNFIEHKNEDKHPSAKVYENQVYCFACSTVYRVTDIIKLKKLDKHELFQEILKDYSKEELEEICKEEKVIKKDIKKVVNEDFIDYTKRYFQVK